MKWLKQLAVLLGITVASAGLTWLIKGPPAAPTILKCDPATLAKDQICLADVTGNVLWVDARPRSEWEKNGISGSLLWNLDPNENQQEFEAQVAMRAIEAELVVVYCGSEACGSSRQIADRIGNLQLGTPIKVLYGGWEALRDSSLAQ